MRALAIVLALTLFPAVAPAAGHYLENLASTPTDAVATRLEASVHTGPAVGLPCPSPRDADTFDMSDDSISGVILEMSATDELLLIASALPATAAPAAPGYPSSMYHPPQARS